MDKRRLTTALARRVVNPLVKAAFALGVAPPGYALLETTGRKAGEPRQTPISNGLQGDVFWIVAEHGRKAGYVRNIEANPRVRVKVRRRWRSGTAQLVPADDARARLKTVGSPLSRLAVRVMETDPLTVRVDLD
jgi:deazaflavin-dependent oxidoreductase (nitroreductase family)